MADITIGDITLRRMKVVTGYAAHARLCAELSDDVLGYIPMMVHQPYRFSSTHAVVAWQGQAVIVAETAHRRYEVFAVCGPLKSEEAAHVDYVRRKEVARG